MPATFPVAVPCGRSPSKLAQLQSITFVLKKCPKTRNWCQKGWTHDSYKRTRETPKAFASASVMGHRLRGLHPHRTPGCGRDHRDSRGDAVAGLVRCQGLRLQSAPRAHSMPDL